MNKLLTRNDHLVYQTRLHVIKMYFSCGMFLFERNQTAFKLVKGQDELSTMQDKDWATGASLLLQ
ncbi:hypothetical protein C0J52_17737 [Blattella germanica]|nr:hypothetical protein C0J52_17737 [Blattella germanica]